MTTTGKHRPVRPRWWGGPALAVLAMAAAAMPRADAAPAQEVQFDGSRTMAVHRIDPYAPADIAMDAKPTKIDPKDDPMLPVSMRNTCGQCHDYAKIRTGWHFNAAAAGAPGRPGEPWVLYHSATGTQAPLSYRGWPGSYRPEQFGVSPWQYTLYFGGHLPGGGVSEPDQEGMNAEGARWNVAGPLEINCLGCHSADPAHDQSVWAKQISLQNFRWAATAAADLATIHGAAVKAPDGFDPFFEPDTPEKKGPVVVFKPGRFDAGGQMFFHVDRPSPNRCYYCHSDRYVGPDVPAHVADADGDIHLAAGLACVDCHRNGIDHNIVRGVEGAGHDTLTCRGCHLGVDGEDPASLPGRLGAPRPRHAGLLPIHLAKLTCTACHSGPWPEKRAFRVQTARTHRMGVKGGYRGEQSPPYVVAPVFAKADDGVIAPYKMLWPAFWARLKRGEVVPIDPLSLAGIAAQELKAAPTTQPADGQAQAAPPGLTETQVLAVLKKLSADAATAGEPVYISGGWMHSLGSDGALSSREHPAAKPYAWPIAHDVRPAGRALGARGCTDCHSADAAFFFGEVVAASPSAVGQPKTVRMHELQGLNGAYLKSLALSFEGRPAFKVYGFIAIGVVAAVVVVYGFFGLAGLLRRNRPTE